MTEGGHVLRNWLALGRPRAPAAAEPDSDRAAARDADGLHRRFLGDVFAYVARRVPDRAEAEDVTAEVFAAAFAALPRPPGPHGPLPWLLGIARRKVADSHRRRTRRGGTETLPETLPAPAADRPEARLARGERARHLRQCVDRLPEAQREALLLCYVEGLPQAQIAVVLGRSPAAVNSLLQRARAAVYKQGYDYFLGDLEPEGEADK